MTIQPAFAGKIAPEPLATLLPELAAASLQNIVSAGGQTDEYRN